MNDEFVKPDVAVDSEGNAHIIWMNPGGDEERGTPEYSPFINGTDTISYKKIDPNGNTIVYKKIIAYAEDTDPPKLDTDLRNNIHMVFVDERNLKTEVFYSKLDNDGNVIIDSKLVSNLSDNYSESTCINVDSNDNALITWSSGEWSGGFAIYYAKIDKNGTVIESNMIAPLEPESYSISSILDTEDNLHISVRYHTINVEDKYYILDRNNIIHNDTNISAISYYYGLSEEEGYENVTISIQYLIDSNRVIYTYSQNSVVDSENNIHLLWPNKKYQKLALNGSLIIENKSIPGSEITFSKQAAIDNDDNIHLVWYMNDGHNRLYSYYMKLDSEGNVLEGPINFTDDNTVLYIEVLIIFIGVTAIGFYSWRRMKSIDNTNE